MAERAEPAGAKFTTYEKIAETPTQWGLDEAALRRLERAPWVVTEKIHGANFCFLVDEGGVRCAKRKALLEPGEDFFGHRAVLRRLEGRLRALFAACRGARPGLATLFVYGELFGGSYPHPLVAPVAGAEPVQTGVHYAPDVEFCAFDLGYATADPAAPRDYFDYDAALAHAAAAGVPIAEPLFRGGYAEAMAYPERFESTLPRRLGLPPLPAGNLAEGVVIKPAPAVWLETPKGRVRPVVKKKIAEFAEDARFHGAVKRPPPRPTGVPALDRLEWEMLALVTPARVDSAVSKLGRPRDAAARARLVDESVADVWASLETNEGAALGALSGDEGALLRSLLREAAEGAAGATS
ncbi:MAG TPA: RNA ligase family protein [Polyangiaceae bacterium]|nr:RNA ligase family protein [Polyangiaceae bacterium]